MGKMPEYGVAGSCPRCSPLKIAGLSVNGYGKTIAPQLTLCYGFFWTNRLAESLVAAERLLRAQLTVETCIPPALWHIPACYSTEKENHTKPKNTHHTHTPKTEKQDIKCMFVVAEKRSALLSVSSVQTS